MIAIDFFVLAGPKAFELLVEKLPSIILFREE